MTVLIGRFLQLMALLILPVALMMGLFRNNVQLEVQLLAIGGAIFVIGWLLGRKAE